MATHRKHPRLLVQHPAGILVFACLTVAWFIGHLLPEVFWEQYRLLSRASAYVATVCMLIPFIHILRRFVRHRYLGSSHRWLSFHIAAAYVGFFFLLLHCRARAEGGVTLPLLVLVWIVMASGVVGFYGQKLLYRLLPYLIPKEYGLERLEPERSDCLERTYCTLAEKQLTWNQIPVPPAGAKPEHRLGDYLAVILGSRDELDEVKKKAGKSDGATPKKVDRQKRTQARVLLARALHRVLARKGFRLSESKPAVGATLSDWRWNNRRCVRENHPELLREMPRAVVEFCDDALDKCLKRPFTVWRWFWAGRESRRLYENRYKRALESATDAADRELVEAIWEQVSKRRLLDLEYRLHALGRLWLLFHGPMALAMLVLLVQHILMSWRFGGR